jgi:LAS superfamily LD-carboxypeptidase LdcB
VDRLIAASNGRVYLESGIRSTGRQTELWNEALAKYGDPEIADNWVARPSTSNHESGLAVDLGGDLGLAVRLVDDLGLPLWRPMSWEPWHFELTGSRG